MITVSYCGGEHRRIRKVLKSKEDKRKHKATWVGDLVAKLATHVSSKLNHYSFVHQRMVQHQLQVLQHRVKQCATGLQLMLIQSGFPVLHQTNVNLKKCRTNTRNTMEKVSLHTPNRWKNDRCGNVSKMRRTRHSPKNKPRESFKEMVSCLIFQSGNHFCLKEFEFEHWKPGNGSSFRK